MLSRIRDAQLQAQRDADQKAAAQSAVAAQQTATQVAGLLNQADGGARQPPVRRRDPPLRRGPDVWIPRTPRASQGRTGAITARTVAEAAASGGGGAGRARASWPAAPRPRAASQGRQRPRRLRGLRGRRRRRRGRRRPSCPARSTSTFNPDAVKAGERYTVNISLLNEGLAPIQIQVGGRDHDRQRQEGGRRARAPSRQGRRPQAEDGRALALRRLEGRHHVLDDGGHGADDAAGRPTRTR